MSQENIKLPNSPCLSRFGNMIPTVVEVRMAVSAPDASTLADGTKRAERLSSKPIDILAKNCLPFRNEKKKSDAARRQAYTNNQAFGTPVDHPTMDVEFDFEKNLALFDKQAIWDEIDATQKPDLVRQAIPAKKKNFRHNENVLVSKPIGYRQIKTDFVSGQEFATDDGLIIPSVRQEHRNQIQENADKYGLSWPRQCDMFARGTVEIVLQLLGGARRLTPQNLHQWPTIVIICDEPYNDKQSEVGISTGRQLASHGLNVMLYVSTETQSNRISTELQLYKATNGSHRDSVKGDIFFYKLTYKTVVGIISFKF